MQRVPDKKTERANLWLTRHRKPIDYFLNSRRTFRLPFFKLVREKIVVWTHDMETFNPINFGFLAESKEFAIKPIPYNSRQFYVNVKNKIQERRLRMQMRPEVIMAGIFVFGTIMMLVMTKLTLDGVAENVVEMMKPMVAAARDLRGTAEALSGTLPDSLPTVPE